MIKTILSQNKSHTSYEKLCSNVNRTQKLRANSKGQFPLHKES